MARNAQGPAPDQHSRLQFAADLFNQELFGGRLKPVYLTVQHKPGSWGVFMPDRYRSAAGDVVSAIALDSVTAVERPLIELLSTLVHEQCHQAVYEAGQHRGAGGHGPQWRQWMDGVGLPPVQIGPTWRQATHRIDPAGPFTRVFRERAADLQALPWQEESNRSAKGKSGSPTDRVRFQCPSCLQNAWGKPSAQLACGVCSTQERIVRMTSDHQTGGTGPASEGPIPTSIPGLPVWTDDIGRELRIHVGIDHPPTIRSEAVTVMRHGLDAASHGDLWRQWLTAEDSATLKAVYRVRAKMTHPDAGGSTEAFKVVQMAYLMLQRK